MIGKRAIGKRAGRAIIVSQRTRHFARLAQILRETKGVSLRMTIGMGTAALWRSYV
jgi:hypothetical protein